MRITKKQRNLLLASYTIYEGGYNWLIDLLKVNEKLDLDMIPEMYQNQFVNVVPHLVKQCFEEWKGDESVLNVVDDLGVNRKPCSLCGTPNRYIFYIENRLNGNKLNVGSDCVEEFTDIQLSPEGKSKSQLLMKAKRLRRMKDINEQFSGIEKIVNEWNDQIDKFNVLIPYSIEKPYIQDGEELRKLYMGFLDDKYNHSVFDSINELLNRQKHHLDEMNSFQELNKQEKFIVSKPIIRWIENNNKSHLIHDLKHDGKITSKLIGEIYAPEFIERIHLDICKILESIGIEEIQMDHTDLSYTFELQIKRVPITLSCKYEKILKHFGVMLFNEKPSAAVTLKNIIKISEIIHEESIEFIVELINDAMKYSKYRVSLYSDSIRNNEIDIINKTNGQVLVYKLKKFVDDYKTLAVEMRESDQSNFENYFDALPDRRYTIEELLEIRDTSGSLSKLFKDD